MPIKEGLTGQCVTQWNNLNDSNFKGFKPKLSNDFKKKVVLFAKKHNLAAGKEATNDDEEEDGSSVDASEEEDSSEEDEPQVRNRKRARE